MTGPRERALAEALAGAFLLAAADGTWTQAGLTAQATSAMQGRRRFVGPLVRDVLARYPRPPVDAPRELAAFVAGCEPFAARMAKLRATGKPLPRVRNLPLPALGMGPSRWPVPRLDDVAALADLLDEDVLHLEWLADARRMQVRAPAGPLHTYRSTWLARPSRTPRLLEAPTARLKRLQRTVLAELLAPIPTHEAAHGFVPCRSVLTGAVEHVGASELLVMDLEGFFTSVGAPRVCGILRSTGYPDAVAHLLTALCTTSTPLHVLRSMPAGGAGDSRFRLRSWLGHAHLAQGAPTSPALANLCAFSLDSRLSGLARSWGLVYTRYADDLAFSGRIGRISEFTAMVGEIVREEGFHLNEQKTRLRRSSQRQTVTGVVVNQRLNAPREEYDRLKAVLHDAALHGPGAADRHGVADFSAHLLGRIAWVEALNPGRGGKLRDAYARVMWE